MNGRREMAPGELRRLRERYAEGVPMKEIVKVHRLNLLVIIDLCKDVRRPTQEKLKRQAPLGLSREFGP